MVYADYYSYLWDMNSVSIDCSEFGAPEHLDDRFMAWSKKYEEVFERRWETGDYSRHHLPEAEAEALYQEGLDLCAEFAFLLEGKCKTLDYRALGRPPKRFEMMKPPDESTA